MSVSDAEVVQRFLESVQQMDIDGALGCLHPEVDVVEPASLPYGGTQTGVHGFTTVFRKLSEAVTPNLRSFEVLDGGPIVVGVIELTLNAHAGDEELLIPVVELYTVADGLIRRIDVYPKDTKVMGDFLSRSLAALSERV